MAKTVHPLSTRIEGDAGVFIPVVVGLFCKQPGVLSSGGCQREGDKQNAPATTFGLNFS